MNGGPKDVGGGGLEVLPQEKFFQNYLYFSTKIAYFNLNDSKI